MEIPDTYSINDYRNADVFKVETYSKYKKSDVATALQKSLIGGNFEESCHWSMELLISGQISEVWMKLINVLAKNINVQNPYLPAFFYNRYNRFIHIHRVYAEDSSSSFNVMEIRNNQMIRNLLAEIITLVTLSDKKAINTMSKITSNDFHIDYFKSQLTSSDNNLVDDVIKSGDPPEIQLVANELAYSLQNTNQSSYSKCCYWINWLFEWEKANLKHSNKFLCDIREKKYIKPQFYGDFVWIIWDVIFVEIKKRPDSKQLYSQIEALYEMYCYEFSVANKRKKMNLIFAACAYLTSKIDWSIPVTRQYPVVVQATANINLIFTSFKKLEKTKATSNSFPVHIKTYNNYIIPLEEDVSINKVANSDVSANIKKKKRNIIASPASSDKMNIVSKIQDELVGVREFDYV